MNARVVLVLLALAGPLSAAEHPLRPGQWQITVELGASEVGQSPPLTASRCITEQDLQNELALPKDFFTIPSGCDIVSRRIEGNRMLLKFGCEGDTTAEIDLRFDNQSFAGSLRLGAPRGFSAVFKGSGKRLGACGVDGTDALLAAARKYAAAENGVGIVLIKGSETTSDLLETVTPAERESFAADLVDALGMANVKAALLVGERDQGQTAMYYALASETFGPWSIDQGTVVLPLIAKRQLAKPGAADTLAVRLLRLIRQKPITVTSLLAHYEKRAMKKVDRKDQSAVLNAVMSAVFLFPLADLPRTADSGRPAFGDLVIEGALRGYEQSSGRTIDRADTVQVAEALVAILLSGKD